MSNFIEELFERHAEKNPAALALMHGDERCSYGELDARANRLAHVLLKHGIDSRSLVGLSLDPSIDMIVSLLAILKAGAAYVPLDPSYPADRLVYMIDHAALALIISDESKQDNWPRYPVLCVDKLGDLMADMPSYKPDYCHDIESKLAYVIYTSGSTGTPKGVMGHHRGLLNLSMVHKETLKVGPGDRVLQFASLSFDAATWEIFMALATGAALVLCDYARRRSSIALAQVIKDQEVSIATLSPSMLSLLELPKNSLRMLISAGEACSLEIAKKWASSCTFVNAYGPTETTVCASLNFVDPASEEEPSIGFAIANHRIYILDEDKKPVSADNSGEIYIAGVGLALGYLNNPSLSKEKFMPDIFSPRELMYRSGDRGRYRANGEIEFLGRLDDQVKLRGYRIEPHEIEIALMKHEAVDLAAVILRENMLVAYIASKQSLSTEVLAHYLKALLPVYMIPSAFVFLSSLPVNANQKVDRQKLKSALFKPKLITEYRAPRNAQEEMLTNIWAKVFNAAPIGIDDNFFELGGHSLISAQIIAEIHKVFNIELAVDSIYKAPTIAELAEHTKFIAPTIGENIYSDRKKTELRCALSAGQEQIWFAEQIIGDLAVFNIPIGLTIKGTLDINWLEQSLNALLLRHEALRSVFLISSGMPIQIVKSPVHCVVNIISESDLENHVCRPFDLENGPLFRAVLIPKTDEYILVLLTHHIIFDGWSCDLLLKDWYSLLDASPALPEPSLSFCQWVSAQEKLLQGESLLRLQSYWKNQLPAKPTYAEIVPDFPRPNIRSFKGAVEKLTMPPSLFYALKNFCAREGVSSYIALLSALYVLLYRKTSQENLVIGGIAANRQHYETHSIIGLFANMIALHIDMREHKDFHTLLSAVREMVLGAQMHQALPFSQVIREAKIAHDPSRTPLFQLMFRYESARETFISENGLSITPFELDAHTSKLDLELVSVSSDSGMIFSLQYDSFLFKRDSIKNLLIDYVAIIEEFITQG